MTTIAVLGHLVEDICIDVSDRRRFDAFTQNLSIEEVLAIAEREDSALGEKAIVTKTFGGPALNWAQYLVPKHDVRLLGVAGNGLQGEELKVLLREKLGVDMNGIKFYGGSLPKFCLVYSSFVRKEKQEWDAKIYWEGNVADEHFREVELKRELLHDADVLALPIADPEIAKRAAEIFCDANPSGKVFYNPGRWLEREDTSFERTYFQEIVKKANWVVLNRKEAAVIQKNMHLQRIERLFDEAERLELIIVTRDKDGSYIYERRGQKKWEYTPKTKLIVNPGQTLGAGDAYSATLLSKILLGSDISDAQYLASTAAEETLGYVGALSQRRVKGETTISEQLEVKRFNRPPSAK